jgi:hypothetical protein
MWALDNLTPYAAERTCVLDENGAREWVVAVKGTFDIAADGTTRLADPQLPPLHVHEFLGEDGASSLKYDADLGPAKPGTDVIVHASAHAPRGKPATQVEVGLRVHRTVKTLMVTDRRWERDLSQRIVPSQPLPFLTVPICYERAYGGFDRSNPDPTKQKLHARNPVGSGITRTPDLLGKPAPSIEPSGASAPHGTPGLGPIACFWAPRVAYAGTYDAKWVETRKPLPPQDMDRRYHMCAPEDQQFIPHLRGDVQVELTNLTPSGQLRFMLPKVYLAFETRFSRGAPVEHRAVLHTVVIEAEVPRVMMVWHTSLACHARYDDIDVTVISEKPYVPK